MTSLHFSFSQLSFGILLYRVIYLFISFYNLKMSAASSANTYSKTFAGIDGAGKRLADEVSTQFDDVMNFNF